MVALIKNLFLTTLKSISRHMNQNTLSRTGCTPLLSFRKKVNFLSTYPVLCFKQLDDNNNLSEASAILIYQDNPDVTVT